MLFSSLHDFCMSICFKIIMVLLVLIEIANLVRAIVDSSKGYKIYAVSYITPSLLLATYVIHLDLFECLSPNNK